MVLSLIVAASENNAIGKDNRLLWHLPNDLKYFKNLTWGMPVIMGRKTYESVGKPLPGRINIVITSNPQWRPEGVIPATGLEDALDKARGTNCKEVFIAGGGAVYRQAMPLADKIYLTRVHADCEADTFFPDWDTSRFELLSQEDHPADEKHTFAYTFQTWQRKQ